MKIEINENHGKLTGYSGKMKQVMSDICIAIDNTSSFDQNFLTEFFMIAEERFSSIAFLESVEVEREHRGKGLGAKMLKEFNEKTKQSHVRFLLARMDSPQAENFNLLTFYGNHGYYPLRVSSGDMLMVNTEHAKFFQSELFGE